MLTQDQISQLRTSAGLSPTPPQAGATDVLSQRRAALGLDQPQVKPQSTLSKLASGTQNVVQSVSGVPNVIKNLGQGIVATAEAHGATENKVSAIGDKQTALIEAAHKLPAGSTERHDLLQQAMELSAKQNELAQNVNEDVGSLDTAGQALRNTGGALLKTGSLAVGGEGAGAIKEATTAGKIAQGAQAGFKAGAIGGGLAGAGQTLETPGTGVQDVVAGGVRGALAGGVVGGAVGGATSALGAGVQKYQASTAKQDPIDKLITPEIKGKSGLNAIKSGKVVENTGLTGSRDYTGALPNYDAMKESVAQVPGLVDNKGNLIGTHLQSVNTIHEAIGTTAQDLRSQLRASKVSFTPQEFNKYLTQVKSELSDNPSIVGDAEKSASKIISKFKSLVATHGYTPEGLLDARQGLDTWISSQKGGAVFNPTTENAISIALRGVRQGGNTFLSDLVPDVAVKQMLAHQTNLYDAIDNIAPKALKEGGSLLERLVGKIKAHPLGALTAASVGGGVAGEAIKKLTGF